MDNKQFERIENMLEKMSRLLAIIALKEVEKESDKIELLASLDFRPIEIAHLLNKSLANVTVVLSNIRKKGKGKVNPDSRNTLDGSESPSTPASPSQ